MCPWHLLRVCIPLLVAFKNYGNTNSLTAFSFSVYIAATTTFFFFRYKNFSSLGLVINANLYKNFKFFSYYKFCSEFTFYVFAN